MLLTGVWQVRPLQAGQSFGQFSVRVPRWQTQPDGRDPCRDWGLSKPTAVISTIRSTRCAGPATRSVKFARRSSAMPSLSATSRSRCVAGNRPRKDAVFVARVDNIRSRTRSAFFNRILRREAPREIAHIAPAWATLCISENSSDEAAIFAIDQSDKYRDVMVPHLGD